jgi:hypothetical protein
VGTLRTRILVAVGAVLIATAGAGSLLLPRSTGANATDSSPFPVGHVFTNAEWSKVETSLSAHGFDASAVRVVSGLRLESNNAPFALVRARSHARGVCFVLIRGLKPGQASCSPDGHLNTPLLAFGAADESQSGTMTEVVGVAQHRISGVSLVDARGLVSGLAIVPTAGELWSVTGGYSGTHLVFLARIASGRIVGRVAIP